MILLPTDSGWFFFEFIEEEFHPSQDVAIFRTKLDPEFELSRVTSSPEYASSEYTLWGYPEHVAFELHGKIPEIIPGVKIIKPEIVYQQGYVRRRISRNIPFDMFRGNSFYEVSEVAGARCSGAPIYKKSSVPSVTTLKIWDVIGIYIGEQTSEKIHAVGICVRSDSFANWVPAIAGLEIASLT